MRILLAIDSFKGCLSSHDIEQVFSEEWLQCHPDDEVRSIAVSDGGEGMLEAFAEVLQAQVIPTRVRNSMMSFVDAAYALKDDLAIIEVAQAVALSHINPVQRNPLVATSYGVGQLISEAYHHGARRFIIGLGGTATCDCGLGMLRILKELDLNDYSFTLASDVTNPLLGENGAAAVFGPQKGARPDQIPLLERRAKTFAEMSARHCGYDYSNRPGAGAAGGLGYAFMQYYQAEVRSGADLLMEISDFDDKLKGVDLVITGEGSADNQTLMGKLPYRILQHARKKNLPVWLVAGKTTDEDQLQEAGFSRIMAITPEGQPLEQAMQKEQVRENIKNIIYGNQESRLHTVSTTCKHVSKG